MSSLGLVDGGAATQSLSTYDTAVTVDNVDDTCNNKSTKGPTDTCSLNQRSTLDFPSAFDVCYNLLRLFERGNPKMAAG